MRAAKTPISLEFSKAHRVAMVAGGFGDLWEQVGVIGEAGVGLSLKSFDVNSSEFSN